MDEIQDLLIQNDENHKELQSTLQDTLISNQEHLTELNDTAKDVVLIQAKQLEIVSEISSKLDKDDQPTIDKIDQLITSINQLPEEIKKLDKFHSLVEAINGLSKNITPTVQEIDLTATNKLLSDLLVESKKKEDYEYDLQIDNKLKEKLRGDKGERGADGSEDSGEQIKEKLEGLSKGKRLDYNKLDNAPDIEQIVRLSKQSSKTVSLVELDDVNLDDTVKENGKYLIGSVQSVVAGTNITVDDTDPANPVISSTGGGGGGTVDSVVAGTGIDVDNTDPANPVVAVDETIATKNFAIAMSIALG